MANNAGVAALIMGIQRLEDGAWWFDCSSNGVNALISKRHFQARCPLLTHTT